MKRLAPKAPEVEAFTKEEYASRRNVGMRGQGRRKHKLSGRSVLDDMIHTEAGDHFSRKPVSKKALRNNTKRARKADARE